MAETKTLDALLERAASWPEEAQAELVRFMIDTEAKHFGVYRLSDDERAAIQKGLEDIAAGRFASDEEVSALFARYRRTA
jgi:lysyl-tRNA synthetase class I